MTSATDTPIPWASVRDTLIGIVRDCSGVPAMLADQKAPRPELPYITLKRISGPILEESPVKPNKISLIQKQIVQFTILNNTEATYKVNLTSNDSPNNPTEFEYTKLGGDSIEDIRDGLQALVNGGNDPITAASVNTDKFDVSTDVVGEYFLYTSDGVGVSHVLTQDILVHQIQESKTFTVSVQAYEHDVDWAGDAGAILDKVLSGIRSSDVASRLNDACLALVNFTGPINLSLFSDNEIESRAALDLEFRVGAILNDELGTIEHAEFTKQ